MQQIPGGIQTGNIITIPTIQNLAQIDLMQSEIALLSIYLLPASDPRQDICPLC